MKTRFLQIESQKIISHAASRISFYQNDQNNSSEIFNRMERNLEKNSQSSENKIAEIEEKKSPEIDPTKQ